MLSSSEYTVRKEMVVTLQPTEPTFVESAKPDFRRNFSHIRVCCPHAVGQDKANRRHQTLEEAFEDGYELGYTFHFAQIRLQTRKAVIAAPNVRATDIL